VYCIEKTHYYIYHARCNSVFAKSSIEKLISGFASISYEKIHFFRIDGHFHTKKVISSGFIVISSESTAVFIRKNSFLPGWRPISYVKNHFFRVGGYFRTEKFISSGSATISVAIKLYFNTALLNYYRYGIIKVLFAVFFLSDILSYVILFKVIYYLNIYFLHFYNNKYFVALICGNDFF
jgi:hypothetical protein